MVTDVVIVALLPKHAETPLFLSLVLPNVPIVWEIAMSQVPAEWESRGWVDEAEWKASDWVDSADWKDSNTGKHDWKKSRHGHARHQLLLFPMALVVV